MEWSKRASLGVGVRIRFGYRSNLEENEQKATNKHSQFATERCLLAICIGRTDDWMSRHV